MSHIEPLKATDIAKYGDETAKYLFKLWEAERGINIMGFGCVSEEYIMRFSGRLEEGLTPKALLCGPQTLAAELVGPFIARQPPDVLNQALGQGYRSFASSIYHDALINFEPMHDLVSSIFTCEGRSYEVVYKRSVFPIKLIGLKQAILHTQKIHAQLIHHQQDHADPRSGSLPAKGPGGLYQDRRLEAPAFSSSE